VPTLLRKLFVAHFIIYFIFAILLMFTPKGAMALMAWEESNQWGKVLKPLLRSK